MAEQFKSAPGPMEIPGWQSQIIRTNTTVSGQGVSNTPGSNPVAVALYNMKPKERINIAVALKNAGYRVPTNGTFSDSLLNAYSGAMMAAQLQAQQLGQNFDASYFSNYLVNEAAAKAATTTGATPIKKSVSTRISDATTAKALIDAVIKDQLGRNATEEEVSKYTSMLRKAQKNAPVTTTYSTKGGVQTSQTTGGINEQRYLIDQVAGTDEAKANKVLGFYETFMNALGRD